MKTWKVYALLDKNDVVKYVGYTSQTLSARLSRHHKWAPEKRQLTIKLLQEFNNKEQAKVTEVIYQKNNHRVEQGRTKCYGHVSHDGSRLVEAGKATRFSSKRRPANEEKRLKHLRRAIKAQRKPVRCINTGIIYPSISECAKVLNLSIGNLSLVLKGTRPHTKGLKFEFV
jgi:predicted GIY-YIG superfamily endonuclease